VIEKRTTPVTSLSKKLYAPKTNAPPAPLSPITSEIRLIAVFS